MKKIRPPLGKIDPLFFNRVIFPRLGAPSNKTIIGPRHGVDFSAIRIGGKVMTMSTDPFFIAPSLGWERAAWFAVHILASDVAVSGIMPTHLSVDLNLPPEMDDATLERIWATVHRECAKLGITIISGHTARYAGCSYPMVGGGCVFGIGDAKNLRDPGRIRAGDRIVITKGPAIESTGLLAAQFPEFLDREFGVSFRKKAEALFYRMSTVKDARIASKVKGVVAMHDATECGIWGGIYEMANAGRWGVEIREDSIVRNSVAIEASRFFGIDACSAISEGTLIAVVRPGDAERLVKLFKANRIPSSIAGVVLPRKRGMHIVNRLGVKRQLVHPVTDPFWPAFEKYLALQAAEKTI